MTFPWGVGVVEANPAWTSFDPGSGEACWDLSDMAPYARYVIELKLQVQPPTPLFNNEPFTLMEGIQPEFTHLFLGMTVQSEPLGPPALQAPNRIDSEPPETPILDPVTTPTRTSPVVISGISEPEARVNLFVNGAQASTTLADSHGRFSAQLVLEEGLNFITAAAFDQFNNGPSVPSAPVQVTLDTTSPGAPELWEIPSPISSNHITIQGYAEENAMVEISLNGQSAGFCQVNSEGSFSKEVELVQGENFIMARATDFLGNGPGPWSNLERIIVDSTAPFSPLINAIPPVVTTEHLEVSGTTEPNAMVEIYVNNLLRGRVKADNEGSFTATVRIFVGENTINVKASDELGNGPGKESTLFVFRDIFAPQAPKLDPVVSPTDQSTIWISGTSEPFSKVEIFQEGKITVTTTTDSSGIFGVPLLLFEGENKITARAFDNLGNGPSDLPDIMIIQCDTTPPSIPVLEAPTLVTEVTTTVYGFSEPFSIIEILVDQEHMGKTIADEEGKFEMDVPLIEGSNLISARAEDQLGNTGPFSQPRNIRLDTTCPEAFIDLVHPGSPQEDTEIKFVGYGMDTGQIVAYIWESDLQGDLGENRVINTRLSSGTHLITFKVQDEAGHWSQPVHAEVKVEKTENENDVSWLWTLILAIIVTGIFMIIVTDIKRRFKTKGDTSSRVNEEVPPANDDKEPTPPDDEDWPPPPPDDE
jgi:hypothetical protein